MTHEEYMDICIDLARVAAKNGDVPVGAIIVKDNKIIGKGYNQKEKKGCAILHAEMVAIKKASKKLHNWHLDGCDIYVTLEPCSMCFSAICQSRIRDIYYGAADDKKEEIGTHIDLDSNKLYTHMVGIHKGIREDECATVLKNFFKELRQGKNEFKCRKR